MLPPIRQSVPDSDPCYWCGGSANSDEHVPPKGIFPELKDIPERDLRFNLLTVRSCEEHNQRKSNNDEYLMAVITPVLGNNEIAIKQTDTKIKRALERNDGSLERAAYIGLEEYSDVVNGQERTCAHGSIDTKRFFDSIEPIARAIYRLHFDCRFSGKCLFFADFLDSGDHVEASSIRTFYQEVIRKDIPNWPSYATNSEVFYFQVDPIKRCGGLQLMAFTFFEGAQVLVGFLDPEVVAKPKCL